MWIPHIDGVPLRKLANEYKLSVTQTNTIVGNEFNLLPDNTWLTKEYASNYSGILILDGKYVKVRGYEKKIPLIWGIDYLTHDIPVDILAPSENEESFSKYFRLLKASGYNPKIVVVDDRAGITTALARHFPHALVQLCHVHFLNNMRESLRIRTETTHHKFFTDIQSLLKLKYLGRLKQKVGELIIEYENRNMVVYRQIVLGIWGRRRELFAYLSFRDCPNNTNLIELYNSHIQARLKSIKGFKTFRTAERWLNAYVVRRRTKELTDCQGKFKNLNGKCSLEIVAKDIVLVKKLQESLGNKNAPKSVR